MPIDTNLKVSWLVARAIIPLIKQCSGVILNY